MFRQDFKGLDETSIKLKNELWVLNDWYTFLPFECPDRIYNVHKAPYTHPDTKNRFVNWIQRYNGAIKKGSKVFVTEQIPGLDAQYKLDTDTMLKTFPADLLQCSVSVMIADAILSGVKRIKLLGVRLRDDEYKYQIHGIRGMIKQARDRGAEVINPRDKEWCDKSVAIVNWGDVKEIVPYWMRGR